MAKRISEGGISAFKQILKIIFAIVAFKCMLILLLSYIMHKPSIDLMKVVENFIPQKYSEIQLSTNNPEEVYQTNT